MDTGGVQRYRCHTGHSYTDSALLTSQTEKIEETLWISLRMFEERKNLLNSMAQQEGGGGGPGSSTARAKEAEIHIERIRAILLSPQAWKRKVATVRESLAKTPMAKSARLEQERQNTLVRKRKMQRKGGTR